MSITIEELNNTFKIDNHSDHRSKKELFSCIASLIKNNTLDSQTAIKWLQEKLGRKNILSNLEYFKNAGIDISIKSEISYLKKTQSLEYIMGDFDDSDIIMLLLKYENPEVVFTAIGIKDILQKYNWYDCYYAFAENKSINEDASAIFLAQVIIYFYKNNDAGHFEDILHEMEHYVNLDLGIFCKIIGMHRA